MAIQVVGHTSFLGVTGYNAHSQAFFTTLNKHLPVRIRNYSHTKDLSIVPDVHKRMIIEQSWVDPPYKIGTPFQPNPKDLIVNIVLNESHHYFFYDKYESPKIAYNVWESTKQIPEYFNRILEYDQFWCPTEWQRQCTIKQGYPEDRVKVVPEGVDGNLFFPSTDHKDLLYSKYNIPRDAFVFMIFGRWDYRKATEEMISAWYRKFGDIDNCYLILSVDNPFSSDGMKTTEERLEYYDLKHKRIKVLHFPERKEYIQWLQSGDCLLSCSRSEGWNLPLMEALACGTPSICSDWGGHLEFADGIAYKVNVPRELPPKNVYILGDDHDLGVWGEPDFEHLEYVMQNVYNNYNEAKDRTVKLSKYLRSLYTWDNAAKTAEGIIKDLVKNKYHFVEKTPDTNMELYQDQYVNGRLVTKGIRDCTSRYEALKKVFDHYKRPFTILDVGANFGYYSIRAASEYDCVSVMVESNKNETDKLIQLCKENDCREKLIVLNNKLDLYKLKELTKCEHFDVVLALNVIHHFDEDIIEVCKTFMELGDNLILETPPVEDSGSCGQSNLKPIIDYFSNIESEELGEFSRHTSNTKSKMRWFKTPKTSTQWPYFEYELMFTKPNVDVEKLKNRPINVIQSNFNNKLYVSERRNETTEWIPGINLKTFVKLNGIYPEATSIINNLKTKNITTEYKWDNTNNDLTCHNIILNGHLLHLIDFNDELIHKNVLNDNEQLEFMIDEIMTVYNIIPERKKIKLNLGCGNDLKPGYINIDRYNNTGSVDMKCDLSAIPFLDNTIDEIYTSHVFEHIPLNDVYSVLEEWERVLIPGGTIAMRLPNLENEVRIWLETPDDRKWFEVHRIFGSQSHEGNTHFNGHNPESLKHLIERFNFKVTSVGLANRGSGEEINLVAKKIKTEPLREAKINTHFVDGPFAEILGDPKDKGFYVVDFLDPDKDSSVHQQTLSINTWTRPHRRYYTNWLIQVKRNGKLVYEHKYNAEGKNVLISFDSKSLGDSIAWIPKVEEFRKKHRCNVYLSTFWNKLFIESYPDLNFVEPGNVVNNLYASYLIGCWEGNLFKNKVDWRTVPLQHVCSDILGLDHQEIICKLGTKPGPRPIEDKYVTISEFSTFQCKFWNYQNGWQEIVDYLNEIGYKVMCISKEETKLNNLIKMNGRPIEETITNILHSEFFIGISSGPSWLAWALRIPTVLISGYSAKWAEFETNIERVINENVCHGCFNKVNNNFQRGEWDWCPFQKETDRQFECSKTITPQMVKDSIQKIIVTKDL